jgi:hypothetical protein
VSLDPREYVTVADRLRDEADAGTLPAEAARRAAIGRYYSAALLSTRELLERESPMRGDRAATTHSWVIRTLGERAESVAQLLSSVLNRMRSSRNRAEYGEPMPGLAEEVHRTGRSCADALRHVATLDRRG